MNFRDTNSTKLKELVTFIFLCFSLTLFSQEGITSEVRLINGIPSLIIDVIPTNANALYIYNVEGTYQYNDPKWLEQFKSYIDQATASGVTYVSFYFGLSFLTIDKSAPVLTEEDLNFGKLDQFFNYAALQGIYVMPIINLSNAVQWWVAENPGYLQTSYDDLIDNSVGFGYQDFRQAIASNIEVIVDHYKLHPALLGWDLRIGVTAENNYGPSYLRDLDNPPESWCDYSQAALSKFRDWILKKYGGDLSSFRSEWGNEEITFETLDFPTPIVIKENAIPAVFDIINGPGDQRTSFRDWQEFRLEVKQSEYIFFIEQFKSLDPSHVIAVDPAANLGMDISFVTRNGFNDFHELLNHPDVDIIVRHPRISVDNTPGPFNSTNESIKLNVQNDIRSGKISTFAMEDTGERVTGQDSIDSHDRIKDLCNLTSEIGGNMGLVIGQSDNTTANGLPIFRDAELATFAEYQDLFNPEIRVEVEKSQVAMLIDLQGQIPMYQTEIPGFSRAFDRLAFIKSLYTLEESPDLITPEEIVSNTVNLAQYKGLILAHLSHLDPEIAALLYNYNIAGGNLYLVGYNGVYNEIGNTDFTAFNSLLGLPISNTYETHAFKSAIILNQTTDVVGEFSSQEITDGNLYNALKFDWESQGFQILAEGEDISGNTSSIMMLKDGILLQFGNIGNISADWKLELYENIIEFLKQGTISDTDELEKKNGHEIKVYPNPCSTYLVVESQDEIDQIEIIDFEGRTVFKISDVNRNQFLLNTSHLAKGVYEMRISSKSDFEIQKFVKL